MKSKVTGVWMACLLCCRVLPSAHAATRDTEAGYIIVWRAGVDGAAMAQHLCGGLPAGSPGTAAGESGTPGSVNCTAVYQHVLHGLAGRFTPSQLARIKSTYKTSIAYVARDSALQLADELADDVAPVPRRCLPEVLDATWGLDSLDQSTLPLDSTYHWEYNGTGVSVYVLDSGIRFSHKEFAAQGGGVPRARPGFDAVTPGGDASDCNSHGTHVAAIIGGNTFGVARNVTLYSVRVLDCVGKTQVSTILKGLEWVAANHVPPAAVHMSIEGGYSSVVNAAVDALMEGRQMQVVVSAGNTGSDACRVSPASTPSVLTVAAVDADWARWPSSNWGPCVDVFAPGVSILSAGADSDGNEQYKTGTSMAAPFVTGVVAQYLEHHAGASPAEIVQKLYWASARGAVRNDKLGYATFMPTSASAYTRDISTTPNRLLQQALRPQATLSPGVVHVGDDAEPQDLWVALVSAPTAPVTITAVVPLAWDGSAIADMYPRTMVYEPGTGALAPQGLRLNPRPSVCEGDYWVELRLRSNDPVFDGGLHTLRVTDARRLTGNGAGNARVIRALPFNDTQDTGHFDHTYACTANNTAPDVTYSYTPTTDQLVSISTCGSALDTVLAVTTEPADASAYVCNDDDTSCGGNSGASGIDLQLKAGVTSFVIVDGYNGASGRYILTITCTSGCGELAPGAPGTAGAAQELRLVASESRGSDAVVKGALAESLDDTIFYGTGGKG